MKDSSRASLPAHAGQPAAPEAGALTGVGESAWPPTVEEFFGSAASEWRTALNALHDFARASRCAPGGDVIAWFGERTKAFQEAPPVAGRAAALDAGIVWRLQRFVEGERAHTIYKLPPSGSYNPLRQDVAALLEALQSSAEPADREGSRDTPNPPPPPPEPGAPG